MAKEGLVSYLQTLFRGRNQLKLLAHFQVWERAAGAGRGLHSY